MSLYLSRNSIILQLSFKNKVFKISTGITTNHFDTITKRVAKIEDFYWEKNQLLNKIESEGIKLQAKAKVEGWIPDKEQIKSLIDSIKTQAEPEQKKIPFVWQYVDTYKERKKSSLSEGHLKNFKSLSQQIKDHWPILTFRELDRAWMETFVHHLLSLELSTNTVAKKIREVKSLAVDARRMGIEVNSSFEDFTYKGVTYPPFFLDWDTQVKSIEAVLVSVALDRVRDRFLFRCYTGMREGEMNQLLPENFYSKAGRDYLKYWDIKGQKSKTIQLSEKANLIAKKYEFNLPVISQQKENDYIKKVGEKAGLTLQRKKIRHSGSKTLISYVPTFSMISTHTARRTFARRWYEQGGDLMKLSKYLGHSSISVTELYIGVEDDEVNDEMIRIFN
jgi:site-specific recombinase XerD